jgi:hypothetical protein
MLFGYICNAMGWDLIRLNIQSLMRKLYCPKKERRSDQDKLSNPIAY